MKFYDDLIDTCTNCGRQCQCARHHLIGGPYRKKSDRLGLYIPLCPDCHSAVHSNRALMLKYRRYAERQMLGRGWTVEKWIEEFGKNYLED